MADIELVIKIPEGAKQAFDCAESNDLKGCYYDHGGVIGNAIKNGTPLPKGHWISLDDFRGKYNENGFMCSKCGEHSDFEENYCPNCGAKMVDPQESEG